MARTKSGHKLGRVSAVEVDELTGKIAIFFVVAEGMIKGLLDNELSVAWNQVVEWRGDELVVADGAVPMGAANVAYSTNAAPAVNMSERT